ncbi:MAG: molybdopterin-dependent oxidoreductase [Bacteroidetes bacterium]|nr:molybdopterin-dependent oxidoreductase [Bacteroidota bacterium]
MRFKILILFLFSFALLSCNTEYTTSNTNTEEMVKAEGKDEMILLTERAPNLETPLHYFLLDYTPNEVFFVRWHLANMPKEIDEDTFKLRVGGAVGKPLLLSIKDLKEKFKPYTLSSLCVCAGNARSFFNPRVAGAQWKNGGMGNAKWTGVKLKDILEMAEVNPKALDVAFNGADAPPLAGVADFVKSLKLPHAMDGEVMIAYEMNGKPLPLLNGFPLKLVVPGYYATYWVGMLNEIKVYDTAYNGYWMKKAYTVPSGLINGNENHDSLAKKTEPIGKMDVRSIFVSPEPNATLELGENNELNGLAFDGGDGIQKVEISSDNGKTWKVAKLNPSLGKYSWRRWKYKWKPTQTGTYKFMVKATNIKGETQPPHQWNRSGYMRNEIETLELKVK